MAEHKDKTFFTSLVDFMTSAPVVVQVLEAEDAVSRYRKIMGATNPAVAEEGTIRKTFALSIDKEYRSWFGFCRGVQTRSRLFFSEIEIFE